MPTLTRADLDYKLDLLRDAMPAFLRGTREEDQMEAFAGIADGIREAAGPEDQAHVWSRMQCILRDFGLIPSDEEPCSDDEQSNDA